MTEHLRDRTYSSDSFSSTGDHKKYSIKRRLLKPPGMESARPISNNSINNMAAADVSSLGFSDHSDSDMSVVDGRSSTGAMMSPMERKEAQLLNIAPKIMAHPFAEKLSPVDEAKTAFIIAFTNLSSYVLNDVIAWSLKKLVMLIFQILVWPIALLGISQFECSHYCRRLCRRKGANPFKKTQQLVSLLTEKEPQSRLLEMVVFLEDVLIRSDVNSNGELQLKDEDTGKVFGVSKRPNLIEFLKDTKDVGTLILVSKLPTSVVHQILSSFQLYPFIKILITADDYKDSLQPYVKKIKNRDRLVLVSSREVPKVYDKHTIFVKAWTGDKSDDELAQVTETLEQLLFSRDIPFDLSLIVKMGQNYK